MAKWHLLSQKPTRMSGALGQLQFRARRAAFTKQKTQQTAGIHPYEEQLQEAQRTGIASEPI